MHVFGGDDGEVGPTAESVGCFTVRASTCAVPEDYDLLLDCIEAASGSLAAFDERMRRMLLRMLPDSHAHAVHHPHLAVAVAPVAEALPELPVRVAAGKRSTAVAAGQNTNLMQYWPWAIPLVGCVAALAVAGAAKTADARAHCVSCAAMVGPLPRSADGFVHYKGASFHITSSYTAGVRTWLDATELCDGMGASLLSIMSPEEDALMDCLLRDQHGAWLGLRRSWEAGGAWRWDDPAIAGNAYFNWAPGETVEGEGLHRDDLCAFKFMATVGGAPGGGADSAGAGSQGRWRTQPCTIVTERTTSINQPRGTVVCVRRAQ